MNEKAQEPEPTETTETLPERAFLKTLDGETLLVRRLAEGDGPALQQFNHKLSNSSRASFLPHAYDKKTIAQYIERSEKGLDRIYVATVGPEIVGYFFLWNIQDRVPLLGIGVADEYQQQGIGKQMMEILIEDARAAGCEGIELTTLPTNERAFLLYQKTGFQYLGDVDNLAGDGRVVRERAMFLPLTPDAKPVLRQFKPPV